jgi:hypothetical protein
VEVELDFATVRERWLDAGGKNTGGIIGWFGQVVERWVESKIPHARLPSCGSSVPRAAGAGLKPPAAVTASAIFRISRRAPAFAGIRTGF